VGRSNCCVRGQAGVVWRAVTRTAEEEDGHEMLGLQVAAGNWACAGFCSREKGARATSRGPFPG
jgi:hypothetical protein